jgi:predicted lipoprotein with Yx(FWY)xxD motif
MTGNWRAIRHRTGGFLGLAAIAVVVAACGSSSGSNKASSPPPNPASSSGGSNAAAKITIGTAKGSAGTYLVGASGRALYLWVADSGGQSSCSGACAKVWPPVTASATPSVTGAVKASDLGWATRSDGTKQVTYNGHPLYYFIADHAAGVTKGQGSNSFGAKWWLVSPAGAGLTKSTSSGGSSGGSSSGSSSGGGWG